MLFDCVLAVKMSLMVFVDLSFECWHSGDQFILILRLVLGFEKKFICSNLLAKDPVVYKLLLPSYNS